MPWSDAKTALNEIIQNTNGNSEIEVDGHRVKKRSLKELLELEDYVCHKSDEETNGATPLSQSGFKVQAFNNGDGLV